MTIPNTANSDSVGVIETNLNLERFVEKFSVIAILKNFAFLVIIGLLLLVNFPQYQALITIVLLIMIIELILVTLIKYWKVQKINVLLKKQVNTQYSRLMQINEKYRLLTSLIITCLYSGLGLLLIISFEQQISTITIKIPNFQTVGLFPLIVIWIGKQWLDLFVVAIRYLIVSNMPLGEDVIDQNRIYLIITKTFELVTFVPLALVFIALMWVIGIPVWIVLGFVVIMMLVFLASLFEILRMNQQKLSKKIAKSIIKNRQPSYIPLNLDPNEKFVGAIFGIMNLNRTGYSVLGVGQVTHSENTILITDHQFIFIQIPMSGGDQIIANTMPSDLQFFFNRDQIKVEGEELIAKLPLTEIVQAYGIQQVEFGNISRITFDKQQLEIDTNHNQRHRYLIPDTTDLNPLIETIEFLNHTSL